VWWIDDGVADVEAHALITLLESRLRGDIPRTGAPQATT
jgi:hypothetical protein